MTETIQKRPTDDSYRTVSPLRFVVLDSDRHWLQVFGKDQTAVCRTRSDVLKVLDRVDSNSLWISRDAENTQELAKTLIEQISKTSRIVKFGRLLILEAVKARLRTTLEGLFAQVIGDSREFKKLSLEELCVALRSDHDECRDLFIGGSADLESETLVLIRGDLERLVVPFSIFRPSGNALPDFKKLEFTDYGHTLKFGDYEATADVVLWEIDPDYRKRAKARERAVAKGFGPSLRRLRKQRGLSQSDFPNVARKTISRIENGDVERPHGMTLTRIAKVLGVERDQIEQY